MAIDMTEVRQLFFEESSENLDVMESNLLDLEIGPIDKELVNSIFRAAHSIKGGAGIFKFEQVVSFAHVAETLLDEMRKGEHLVTQPIIDLLLRAVDILRMILSSLKEHTECDWSEVSACQTRLKAFLKTPLEGESAYGELTVSEKISPIPQSAPVKLPEPTSVIPAPIISATPLATPLPLEVPAVTPVTPTATSTMPASASLPVTSTEPTVATASTVALVAPTNIEGWQIIFKPHLEMLKTGNDPINLFRELAGLGALEVKADTHQVPTFTDLTPHSCYLNWELMLHANVAKSVIEEIFEWVENECDLQITSLPVLSAEDEAPIATVPDEITTATTTSSHDSHDAVSSKHSLVNSPRVELPPPAEGTVSNLPSPDEDGIGANQPLPNAPPASNQLRSDQVGTKPLSPVSPVETPLASTIEPLAVTSSLQCLDPHPLEGPISPRGNSNQAPETGSSIRVGIDKVDSLINLVGELVITQSMLEQVGENFDHSKLPLLRDGLSQLERNTRELQESVMRIRMLPISYSFNRFPRLVHDLSVQLGKKVELKLSGVHTELDKTVLEKMSDPLVHLVRNALDHGIEMPAQRRATGKSEVGLLHLHAFHQGGSIIIQISDDGAGFDLARIRDQAIKQRLLNREDNPTEEQLYEFVFQPGFSTANQVSDLSGRGVGMDVVRRNIRSLGGTIEIQSKPGRGTTFNIRLPLTLAILDGQLVRVGTEIYILSLLSIIESLRVKPKLVNSLAGKAEVYKLRDEYIPILRLYELFDIVVHCTTQLDQGLLVIVEGDGQKIGLFVDELLSQQQIVIKSLESNFKQMQGISGATILGDGSVALILDVAGLIQLFHHKKKIPTLRSTFTLGVSA